VATRLAPVETFETEPVSSWHAGLLRLRLPLPDVLRDAVTDQQHDVLWILLSSKQLTKSDFEAIYMWLGSAYDDWDWVIDWLMEKPDVPLKVRRRMKPADYGTAPPTP
jgi:hypothetical protein